MDRTIYYLLITFLSSHACGCRALGPLSPLRPLERSLVFSPSRTPADQKEHLGDVPDVWFQSDDGIRLHGQCFDHPQPRAVALFCHGNAGSVEIWSKVARYLKRRHQLTVFVFDYRGYGKSAGDPTEIGVLRDCRAARKWLAQHAGIKEAQILLMGRSLGGAVAVDLAAKGGARGLVLESTFSSLPDVAAADAPWIAPHWNMNQRMDSVSKIVAYKGPLLQSHGDADRLIPVELAKKLYAAALGKKRFYLIPGKDHNDPEGEFYAEALDEFLGSLPPSAL